MGTLRRGVIAIAAFRAGHRSRVRGRATVWPQGSAALIAVLRAVEILSFAPVAGNHRRQKSKPF